MCLDAAMPPDVRKAFGLPVNLVVKRGCAPNCGLAQKRNQGLYGKAEPFRTSGGPAADLGLHDPRLFKPIAERWAN